MIVLRRVTIHVGWVHYADGLVDQALSIRAVQDFEHTEISPNGKGFPYRVRCDASCILMEEPGMEDKRVFE